jgi:hypothetical protein
MCLFTQSGINKYLRPKRETGNIGWIGSVMAASFRNKAVESQMTQMFTRRSPYCMIRSSSSGNEQSIFEPGNNIGFGNDDKVLVIETLEN